MKRIFVFILILLSVVAFVSCEKNMTAQIQEQLKLQDAQVRLTVGQFSDACTVTCRDGEYVLSDFSRAGLHDLTVRLGEGSVQHTLSDLSLSPISEGVEGFLQLYRLLYFLREQEYLYRDAEQEGTLCFFYSFEGENAAVRVTEEGKLCSIVCGLISIEIQEGND